MLFCRIITVSIDKTENRREELLGIIERKSLFEKGAVKINSIKVKITILITCIIILTGSFLSYIIHNSRTEQFNSENKSYIGR